MCDSSSCSAASNRRHPSQTYGWVDGDAYHSFTGSMRSTSWSRDTRGGPSFTPGNIYEVQYVQPFSFTRRSNTLCVYPAADMENGGNDSNPLNYCWNNACDEQTKQNAHMNYMYVIGYINGTERSKLLILFYNGPCCDDDTKEECRGSSIWIPAIYDLTTGQLASEIGHASVEGNAQNACWSIFTDSVRQNGDDMCVTTGHYTARASLLCDCNRMQTAIGWLRYILCGLMRQNTNFANFVDLSSVMFALNCEDGRSIVTQSSCCALRGPFGESADVRQDFAPPTANAYIQPNGSSGEGGCCTEYSAQW